jgi:hypothetical protein
MDVFDFSTWPAALLVGVLVLLVVREIPGLVRTIAEALSKRSEPKAPAQPHTQNQMLSDLWKWHNVRDDEGIFVWYTRYRTLEKSIGDLTCSVEAATKSFETAARDLENLSVRAVETQRKMSKQFDALAEILELFEKRVAEIRKRNGG